MTEDSLPVVMLVALLALILCMLIGVLIAVCGMTEKLSSMSKRLDDLHKPRPLDGDEWKLGREEDEDA